jgi:hypothetical protein
VTTDTAAKRGLWVGEECWNGWIYTGERRPLHHVKHLERTGTLHMCVAQCMAVKGMLQSSPSKHNIP